MLTSQLSYLHVTSTTFIKLNQNKIPFLAPGSTPKIGLVAIVTWNGTWFPKILTLWHLDPWPPNFISACSIYLICFLMHKSCLITSSPNACFLVCIYRVPIAYKVHICLSTLELIIKERKGVSCFKKGGVASHQGGGKWAPGF